MTVAESRILNSLHIGPMTCDQVSKALGLSVWYTRRALNALVEDGRATAARRKLKRWGPPQIVYSEVKS